MVWVWMVVMPILITTAAIGNRQRPRGQSAAQSYTVKPDNRQTAAQEMMTRRRASAAGEKHYIAGVGSRGGAAVWRLFTSRVGRCWCQSSIFFGRTSNRRLWPLRCGRVVQQSRQEVACPVYSVFVTCCPPLKRHVQQRGCQGSNDLFWDPLTSAQKLGLQPCSNVGVRL